jgi:hypothetical protein
MHSYLPMRFLFIIIAFLAVFFAPAFGGKRGIKQRVLEPDSGDEPPEQEQSSSSMGPCWCP